MRSTASQTPVTVKATPRHARGHRGSFKVLDTIQGLRAQHTSHTYFVRNTRKNDTMAAPLLGPVTPGRDSWLRDTASPPPPVPPPPAALVLPPSPPTRASRPSARPRLAPRAGVSRSRAQQPVCGRDHEKIRIMKTRCLHVTPLPPRGHSRAQGPVWARQQGAGAASRALRLYILVFNCFSYLFMVLRGRKGLAQRHGRCVAAATMKREGGGREGAGQRGEGWGGAAASQRTTALAPLRRPGLTRLRRPGPAPAGTQTGRRRAAASGGGVRSAPGRGPQVEVEPDIRLVTRRVTEGHGGSRVSHVMGHVCLAGVACHMVCLQGPVRQATDARPRPRRYPLL